LLKNIVVVHPIHVIEKTSNYILACKLSRAPSDKVPSILATERYEIDLKSSIGSESFRKRTELGIEAIQQP